MKLRHMARVSCLGNNEVLAREGIDTLCQTPDNTCLGDSNNEVLAREGIDTHLEEQNNPLSSLVVTMRY